MKIKLFLLNYIIKEKQYYMRVDGAIDLQRLYYSVLKRNLVSFSNLCLLHVGPLRTSFYGVLDIQMQKTRPDNDATR